MQHGRTTISCFLASGRSVTATARSVVLGLVLALCPLAAQAHLVSTGLGPVYDGITHFAVSPEDLLPALALALYAGLRGTTSSRRAMFLLPLAWFAGGLAGSIYHGFMPVPVTATSLLVLGALVAADMRMPATAVAALAIVLGLIHGFFNGSALREGLGTFGLLGIIIASFALVTLASALVVSLEKPWTRIAIRAGGSWIFATGMLMIGWFIHGS
jgi:urease accessory protein